MNKSNKLLSEIVAYRTYAKHLSHLNRRETLEETINRNLHMYLDRYPKLSSDILKAFKQIHNLNVMPSMRSMQFAGKAIEQNNVRLYNCSFLNIDYIRSFSEILFLLLSGTGVGFSVQRHHIECLPKLRKPNEEGFYLIHDSITGWSEALDKLINAYYYGAIRPIFNFNDIRPKGSYLITTGAKAPGHEPLKLMLNKVEEILKEGIGRKLRSIEIHDMICIISDCVLAGGIRRSSCISLFDRNDIEMLECKTGSWWEKNPQRARSNNSVVLPRGKITKEEFRYIYDMTIKSNGGEPGFFWTNNLMQGTNPCAEIALNSNQFCNLTTTSLSNIKNDKDLHNRVYASALLGTLQAGFTNFPYLNSNWKKITEDEALLGCSFTGIADSNLKLTSEQLQTSAKLVLEVNEKYSKKIGVNLAKRTTTLKPEGSASCVLGSSSGIHARHSQYYLRRVRMVKNDELVKYLTLVMPELVEDDLFSTNGVVVTIPQESPSGSILRENESALSLFNRIKFYYDNWILPGHREGDNTHNVSCTINYKPEEIDELFEVLWNDRDKYAAVSLLPFDNSIYKQAPFESCSKEEFEKSEKIVKDIDLTKVLEFQDNTNRTETVSCGGGSCEIT